MCSIRSFQNDPAICCQLIAVLLLTSAVMGCGGSSSRHRVYGEVTVDGEPLDLGVITFRPAEGTKGPVVGGPIKSGKYQLKAGDGPMQGEYLVEISSKKKGEREVMVMPGEPPGYASIETIAPQYNTRTTLKVSIEEGTNVANFPLESKVSSR